MKNCSCCGINLNDFYLEDCSNIRHANPVLEMEYYYPEPSYEQRLKDGFAWLHCDEDNILDKYGYSKGSGNY